MNWLKGVLTKQIHLILSHRHHAILSAVAMALLPYTLWVSVAIIALITLRKGIEAGGFLLLIVMASNFGFSLLSMSASLALVNVFTTFVPCYLAALVLRVTVSWRAVAISFLLQGLVVILMLQILMPQFIMTQYVFLQAMLRETQANNSWLTYLIDKAGVEEMMLASYFLGFQMVGVFFSALLSLMTARSVQSALFFPGEFRREMLSFRGEKLGLVLLILLVLLATQQGLIAASLVPLLLFYFMLAGLSLVLTIFGRQKSRFLMPMVVLTFMFLPFIMFPVYVIFGSLDSLINFRTYLPSDAGKTSI